MNEKPIGFVTERRARILREKHRAEIVRIYPFIIRIKDVDANAIDVPQFQLKIDPGAQRTGLAVIRLSDNAVCWYAQIEHRGQQVHDALKTRADVRRNRRSREVRHRRNKFWSFSTGPRNSGKRPGKEGWLPPSVKSVGDNVIHWVERLTKWIPITCCSFEACRFDTQLMDNPNISGIQYQHGDLEGTEIRQYLLEKYCHTCQYCGGASGDPILEVEHMLPKSRGGTNRLSNLNLACSCCNRDKDNRTVEEYLAFVQERSCRKKQPTAADTARLKYLPEVAKKNKTVCGSSRYAAWTNTLRKYEEKVLYKLFGSNNVECASGGRTKYNRTRLGLPKDHHIDALCVGSVPDDGYKDLTHDRVLMISACGRGTRLRGQINACGVIKVKYKNSRKRIDGFQTGDIVRANCPKGKYKGVHIGRVMIRSSGWFSVRTTDGQRIGVSSKNCTLLQRQDGYQYRVEIRANHAAS